MNVIKTLKERLVRKFSYMKRDPQLKWLLKLLGRYALVCLGLAVWSMVMIRVGQAKALKTYESWLEAYKVEQERLATEEALRATETDPLRPEAELLAQVLYGVKDNSTDDLRTYCWCVFNRVDNKAYPDTVADVIAQPGQWMRYDPTNPILENLYQIAYEQLNEWYTNNHRPVSSDYVFMNWSTSSIVLRDNFYEGSGTHYWRWKQ